jgi:hypothetical protein
MSEEILKAAKFYRDHVLAYIKEVKQEEPDWSPGYGALSEDAFLSGANWVIENADRLTKSSVSAKRQRTSYSTPSAPAAKVPTESPVEKQWENAMKEWTSGEKPQDGKD